MSVNDRDWMREGRKRRNSKRRWRWPYQLRPDLAYWVREWMHRSLFVGALGLLFLAWSHFRG